MISVQEATIEGRAYIGNARDAVEIAGDASKETALEAVLREYADGMSGYLEDVVRGRSHSLDGNSSGARVC